MLARTPRRHTARRLTSSSRRPSSTGTGKDDTQLLAERNSIIQRHGPDDGIVHLNVGGKTFQTLRSTISQNRVLMDHVVRAELNNEILGKEQAIFIDRDPKHFTIILSYLRNRADGLHRYPSMKQATKLLAFRKSDIKATEQWNDFAKSASAVSTVQLPKDTAALSELYLEALHYQISPLMNAVCSQRFLSRLLENFPGVKNPINLAASVMAGGRNVLKLLGGTSIFTGTLGMGWMYTKYLEAREMAEDFWKGGDADKEKESKTMGLNDFPTFCYQKLQALNSKE